jgi:MFS family permease
VDGRDIGERKRRRPSDGYAGHDVEKEARHPLPQGERGRRPCRISTCPRLVYAVSHDHDRTGRYRDRHQRQSHRVYLAILQLVFTLGWTTYVIYLPKLAADVGIAPSAVILILMMDQAIFTVTDTVMGVAADKIAPFVGRLGLFVGLLTAVSCAAFVALPFVAGVGKGAQVWLIALIVIWAITSSALRAPPLTLLGNHCAKPRIPLLAALVMLGYGVAGAVSPYLGVVLRDQDARLPFAISSVVLLITALALSFVERGAAEAAPGQTRHAGQAARHRTGDLHRRDGHSCARLSAAFFHQQRAVLSAVRQARRSAMADAGVLDRLQRRDVSGEPCC